MEATGHFWTTIQLSWSPLHSFQCHMFINQWTWMKLEYRINQSSTKKCFQNLKFEFEFYYSGQVHLETVYPYKNLESQKKGSRNQKKKQTHGGLGCLFRGSWTAMLKANYLDPVKESKTCLDPPIFRWTPQSSIIPSLTMILLLIFVHEFVNHHVLSPTVEFSWELS